jgi:ferredoxin
VTRTSHVANVEPAGLRIEVLEGETLFDAAYREGYDWPTICGGQARCTHCHVRLVEGEAGVAPVATENERRLIKRLAQRLYGNEPAGLRLACQLELHADVTVEQATFRGERLPDD